MRTNRPVLAGVALVLMSSMASTAFADDVTGTYDVKYEEVSNNCPSPLAYAHGKLEIAVKGKQLTVDIDRTPLMIGAPAKGGKVSAKSRSGKTMLDGMDGTFSVAGRVTPDGMLTLLMVGEYTASGKALCTQSWNVVGAKADGPSAKPPGKAKKQAADGADASPMALVPALLSSR